MKIAYDEMYAADGSVRESYRSYAEWLQATPDAVIARKREEADIAFHRVGITFAVYGEDSGQERLIPFDIVPRIIPAAATTIPSRSMPTRPKHAASRASGITATRWGRCTCGAKAATRITR